MDTWGLPALLVTSSDCLIACDTTHCNQRNSLIFRKFIYSLSGAELMEDWCHFHISPIKWKKTIFLLWLIIMKEIFIAQCSGCRMTPTVFRLVPYKAQCVRLPPGTKIKACFTAQPLRNQNRRRIVLLSSPVAIPKQYQWKFFVSTIPGSRNGRRSNWKLNVSCVVGSW